MAISTRRLRPLTIDRVRWRWRVLDAWAYGQLMVAREDRRTMAWYIPGPIATVRVVRYPRDALEGTYLAPALPEFLAMGPAAAAALARWVEGPAEKTRAVAAAPPALPVPVAWSKTRAEGRRWFVQEGADEEPVRAVIEERLQRPVVAPMLSELEAELGEQATRSLARECLEALVARGSLPESWLGGARTYSKGLYTWPSEGEPEVPSLRVLWALARAPAAVEHAERLVREHLARERAFMGDAGEHREGRDGPVVPRWIVVERALWPDATPVVLGPGVRIDDLVQTAETFAWWKRAFGDGVFDALAWPMEAYREDAQSMRQSPLATAAYLACEAERRWSVLRAEGARFAPFALMRETLMGEPIASTPSLAEPAAGIVGTGHVLWGGSDGEPLLVASLR
jgi:hypothetical protein